MKIHLSEKEFLEAEIKRLEEKYKWDIHSCGPTCTKAVCVAIREAVEAEREACLNCYSPDDTATDWADKIRARGNT
jgi:hypothetical protein